MERVSERVLVTGGSGFLAAHCIAQLLQAGYRVRATVRSPDREPQIRAMLRAAGVEPSPETLSFAAADLSADSGWTEAVEGCASVLHVASPFPARAPRHPDELIRPAVDGTLRVLRAARDAGVKRLVLTSSVAAVQYGHPPRTGPFTEGDWTDPEAPGVSAYARSKTLAERAAWEFLAREGGPLQLAAVNPVGIYGPVLGPDYATSILAVQRLLAGQVPGCPRVSFGVVDVRDVADLHLLAMTHPEAAGRRFIATAGDYLPFAEIARILKARMGAAASRVTTRELPDWLIRAVALLDRDARLVVPELGRQRNATSAEARHLLGWSPRSREDALTATAESLLRLGLVRGLVRGVARSAGRAA